MTLILYLILIYAAGALLTVQNKEGKTPYDIAVETNNTSISKILNPNASEETMSDTESDENFADEISKEKGRKRKASTQMGDLKQKRQACRKSASAAPARQSHSSSDDSSSAEEIDVDAVVACTSENGVGDGLVANKEEDSVSCV